MQRRLALHSQPFTQTHAGLASQIQQFAKELRARAVKDHYVFAIPQTQHAYGMMRRLGRQSQILIQAQGQWTIET
ncbi:hypothetical protein GCM10027046_29230 [Uliginosibacterium flavum]